MDAEDKIVKNWWKHNQCRTP